MLLRPVAALAAFTVLASAQAPEQTRAFSFVNTSSPRQMQEVMNAIRAIAEVRDATADPTQRLLTVGGSEAQLGLTAWLFADLDQPAGHPSELVVRASSFADPRASDVRIYQPAHVSGAPQLQELVNALRSVAEIQRVVVISETSAIVVRGTAEQGAFADWLVGEIDRAAAGGAQGVRNYSYDSGNLIPAVAPKTSVRIYYPAQIRSAPDLQEALNGLRTIGDLQRAVIFTAPAAIVLRGSAEQAAAGDWLVREMDQAAPASGSREYLWSGIADGIVQSRVLSKDADLAAAVARVRDEIGIRRVAAYRPNHAILMRGNAQQIAAADELLRPL
jgi:hypothetical protein